MQEGSARDPKAAVFYLLINFLILVYVLWVLTLSVSINGSSQQFISHFGLGHSQLVKGFSVCVYRLFVLRHFWGLLAALWSAAKPSRVAKSRQIPGSDTALG